MRKIWDASKIIPHPEERRQVRLEGRPMVVQATVETAMRE